MGFWLAMLCFVPLAYYYHEKKLAFPITYLPEPNKNFGKLLVDLDVLNVACKDIQDYLAKQGTKQNI